MCHPTRRSRDGGTDGAPRRHRPQTTPCSLPTREAYISACAERDEYRDLLLRKTAEFDNYRKRIERERREQAAAGIAEMIEALLPIVDDFERALAIEPAAGAEAYRAGVELIYRQLTDLLARYGVTPIQAVGADFDPRFHEAVLTEASPDRPGR